MLASSFQPEGAVSGQPYPNANDQSQWMYNQGHMPAGGGGVGYGVLPPVHSEWPGPGAAAGGAMSEMPDYDWSQQQQPAEASFMPDMGRMPPYSSMPPQYGQYMPHMPPQYGQYMPPLPPQYPLMDVNSLARLASRIQWEQQFLYQQLALLQAQSMYAGMPWNYYGGYEGMRDDAMKWPGASGVPGVPGDDAKSVSSRRTVTSVDSASAMAHATSQARQTGRRRELNAAERCVLDTELLTRTSGNSLQHSPHAASSVPGSYSHQCAALIGLGFDPRHLATPLSPYDSATGGEVSAAALPQIHVGAGAPTPVTAGLASVPLTAGLVSGAGGGLWGGPSAAELSVQGTVGSSRDAGLATDTGITTDAHDVSSDYGAAASEDGRESWGIKSAPATPSGRPRAANSSRVQAARSHSRRRDRRRVTRSSTASSAKSSDASTGGRVTKTPARSFRPRPDAGKTPSTQQADTTADVTADITSPDLDPSATAGEAEVTHDMGVESNTTQLSITANTPLESHIKGKHIRSKRGHFLLCGLSRNSSGSCPHIADNAQPAMKTKTPSPSSSSRQVTGVSSGRTSGHEDSELEKDCVVDDITRKLLHMGVRRSSGEQSHNVTGDSELTGDTGGDSEDYDSECSVDSEERIQIERMLARHHGNVRESSISLNTQDFALYEQEFEATSNATRSTRLPPVTQQAANPGPAHQQASGACGDVKTKSKKKDKGDPAAAGAKIKVKSKQNCKLQ